MSNETSRHYQTFPPIATITRHLASGARVLNAGILPRADEIEMLAFDSQSGVLRDSATHRRWAALKGFVVRNWGSRFSLRVCARESVADEVRATLGPPDYFEAVSGAAHGEVRGPWEAVAAVQRFRVEDTNVHVWGAVTLRFPDMRLRHIVIREVRVVLVEPRRRSAEKAESGRQLKLEWRSAERQ